MNMIPAPSERARTAPPLLRGAFTPAPWFGFWRGLLFALWPGQRWPGHGGVAPAWHAVAQQRRRVLIALVLALAGAALALRVGESNGAHDALWWSTTALMTLLFAWVGVGCATATMGVWALFRGDRFAPALASPHGPIDPAARTAIVMPICNEDIVEVFAGLRATCESLAATGAMKLFDVFVLSDTADPALRAAEQRAWARLRTMLGETEGAEGGRLFYRWRKRRTKRKSGNVADFCRRWGRRYRYMVVLDADSTMSGDTLVEAGAPDGAAPARRHHPDAAADRAPGHAARARPAVRQPRQRSPVCARHGVVAARRCALLGPQRDPARAAVHAALRARAPAGARCAGRRDPVARLRRGGADGPRRLRGVAGAAARRQLGAKPVEPARRVAARPPLVPGQSAEHSSGGRARAGAPRTA